MGICESFLTSSGTFLAEQADEGNIGTADAAQHGHILPVAIGPSHGLANDAGPGLELPELLAGIGVERHELAGLGAGKDQVAAGHDRAAPVGDIKTDFPFGLARERFNRPEVGDRFIRLGDPLRLTEIDPEVELSGDIFRFRELIGHAHFQGIGINQA